MTDVEMPQQSTAAHEIPDYNTIYNTPGGNTYAYVPASSNNNVHPFAQAPPSPTGVRFDGDGVSPFDNSKPVAPDSTTPAPSGANGVALLPSQPNTSTDQHSRRRSSIGDMLASVFTGGNKDQKDLDLQRTRSASSAHHLGHSRRSSRDSKDLGRRRSVAFLSTEDVKEGNQHKGPYAHISKAQAEHMERLREAERNLGRTTNIDGLPLPQAQMDDKRQRRRSSLANVLGLNKKMLAF